MNGLYLGAALKGIGDGGGVLSQAMIAEQARQDRWDEQRQNQSALESQRQKYRLELLDARSGARGGGKGGGVISEELMASKMGMSVPEYRKFVEMEQTGSDAGYRTDQVTDNESGGGVTSELPAGFADFVAKKRAERAKLMETYSYSDDIDKIAKSRQVDQEVDLTGRAVKGERAAGEGLLYAHGKDPRETDAKATKAEADAARATADADLKGRTDPNIRRSGGGGRGGGSDANKVQSTKVDGDGKIILVMKDGSIKETGRTASTFNKDVAGLVAKLSKDDYKFSKLTPEEKRAAAMNMLVGGSSSGPVGTSAGGSKWKKIGG